MRFFGPTIKRVAPGGERHIPRARTLLGIVARRMELGGLQQLVQRWKMSDGFTITAGIITGIPFIEISGVVASVELSAFPLGSFLVRPAYSDNIVTPDENPGPWWDPTSIFYQLEGNYRNGWKPPYYIGGEENKEDGLNLGVAAINDPQTFLYSTENGVFREHTYGGGNIDWRSSDKTHVLTWFGPHGRTMYPTPINVTTWESTVWYNGQNKDGPESSYVFGAGIQTDFADSWIVCIAFAQWDTDYVVDENTYSAFGDVLFVKRLDATGTGTTRLDELQDLIANFQADEPGAEAALSAALNGWIRLEELDFAANPVIQEFGGESFAYYVDPQQTQPWFLNGTGTKGVTIRTIPVPSVDSDSVIFRTTINLSSTTIGEDFLVPSASVSTSTASTGSTSLTIAEDPSEAPSYKTYSYIRGLDFRGATEVQWVEQFERYNDITVDVGGFFGDTVYHKRRATENIQHRLGTLTIQKDCEFEVILSGLFDQNVSVPGTYLKETTFISFHYVDLRYSFVHYAIQDRSVISTNSGGIYDTGVRQTDSHEVYSERLAVGGSPTTIYTSPDNVKSITRTSSAGSWPTPQYPYTLDVSDYLITNGNSQYIYPGVDDGPGTLESSFDDTAVPRTLLASLRGGWALDDRGNVLVSAIVGVSYSPEDYNDPIPYIKEVYNSQVLGNPLATELETIVPSGKYFTAFALSGADGIRYIGPLEDS